LSHKNVRFGSKADTRSIAIPVIGSKVVRPVKQALASTAKTPVFTQFTTQNGVANPSNRPNLGTKKAPEGA